MIPRPRARPSARTGVLLVIAATVIAATMIWAGVSLLVQSQTGTRAMATVGDCVGNGGTRYRSVHCTGTWIVGGSLIDGGHVIWGTINGVDTDAVGKTIEVTLRGDSAYARGLTLPLLLIGFGLMPAAGAVFLARGLRG